jgi:hypothetical protein
MPAAALVGWCRVVQQFQGWAVSNVDLAEGAQLARQALERARDDPQTMVLAAYTLFHVAGETTALAVVDRALRLNPHVSLAWMARSNGNAHCCSISGQIGNATAQLVRKSAENDAYRSPT